MGVKIFSQHGHVLIASPRTSGSGEREYSDIKKNNNNNNRSDNSPSSAWLFSESPSRVITVDKAEDSWMEYFHAFLVIMAVSAQSTRCTSCSSSPDLDTDVASSSSSSRVANPLTTTTIQRDSSPPGSRVVKSYRPHGSFARILYDKQKADERLNKYDKNQWYRVDHKLIREDLRKIWVPLGVGENHDEPDDVAYNFLRKSTERSDSLPLQAWHSLARSALSWFISRTSINGLLGRGSMHVFSSEQFEKLMTSSRYSGPWDSLIDLGAGDGATTSHIAHLFKNVYATEISPPMRWALARRGFTVLDVDKWHEEESSKFDVILCLNLLDRCDKPNTLLRRLKSSLSPGGRLVVALVLPFSPYVEVGERNDHKPSEYLPIKGNGLEGQIASLIDRVFSPLGLKCITWSKLPYLCEGDLGQAFYFLDDVIFVLEAEEEEAYCSISEETETKKNFLNDTTKGS